MLALSLKYFLIGLACASIKADFRDNSINLTQVDPLTPNKIRISQGTDSPVNIDIVFTNNKIYGASKAMVTKVTGFGEDLTNKHSITFKVHGGVSLVGDYIVSGKILILPIQGEGKSNLTLVDPTIRMEFSGTADEKNGDIYMKVTNFRVLIEPKSMIYKFDNLFNGDKALGDNMNKFLNENWKEIFNENYYYQVDVHKLKFKVNSDKQGLATSQSVELHNFFYRWVDIRANDPKPCNYGDTECIKKITSYFLSKKEGDNSINLSEVDPLTPNKIHINQGSDSPVNIDIVLTNNKIYGASNAVVTKVTGFGKDLTKKHSITIQVPGAVSLLGDYALSGKVLILPIQGEGKSNLTLVNTVFSIDFVGMADGKDGEVYMKLKNFHLHVDPQSFIFHFDNLFNGDKALGDNMNKFLNENWKEIFNELRASIEKEFGAVVDKIISQVYTKYPYAKYFKE
uniref:Uncharacterized protein n=1 Tax=Glossina pallidipes TaxID=7398 RepID=A0A1A9ZDH2_GLOPL